MRQMCGKFLAIRLCVGERGCAAIRPRTGAKPRMWGFGCRFEVKQTKFLGYFTNLGFVYIRQDNTLPRRKAQFTLSAFGEVCQTCELLRCQPSHERHGANIK